MSKDFEKAYRELAKSECPDLWDRIEAGLIERSAPGKQEAERNFQVLVQKDICQEEKPQAKDERRIAEKAQKEADKKSNMRAIVKTYGGVAAAVVCAAVIIPAFLNISSTKSGSMEGIQENTCDSAASGSAAAVDDSAAEPEDMSAMDSGAESEDGASDRGQEAIAAAGGADMEKAVIMEEADMESALAEDKMTDAEGTQVSEASGGAAQKQEAEQQKTREEKENAQDGRQDFGMNTAEAMAESKEEDKGDWSGGQASEEEKSKEPDDGTVFQIIVEVAQADEIYEGETPAGTLYTVVIHEDKADFFKEGEQIEIYAPVYSSQALIKDGVFDVDIVYKQEEDHPYILQLCRREYVGSPDIPAD